MDEGTFQGESQVLEFFLGRGGGGGGGGGGGNVGGGEKGVRSIFQGGAGTLEDTMYQAIVTFSER